MNAGGTSSGRTDRNSAPVTTALRLLLLEDDPYDAELELRELAHHGLTFSAVRVVTTETDFLAALEEFDPHVVLADYRLPGMTGETTLQHSLTHRPRVPFIFVTGALGDDHAAELLKRGAWDYVLKERPGRLGPAVARVLTDAAEHRRLESERASALQRLQERTQQLEAIVNTIRDGLSLFEAVRSQEGRVLDFVWRYANPVALQLLQRPVEEVVGHTVLQLLPSFADKPPFRQLVELVETGEPLHFLLTDVDEDSIHGTFEGQAARLGDGAVVVYRDVTDRHAAERALRRSEARYRGLILALGDGILVQDTNGIVRECNEAAERILGLSRTALLGHRYPGPETAMLREDGTVLPPQEHPAFVALATGRPQQDTVIGIRGPERDTLWVLTNVEPFVTDDAHERESECEQEGVVTSYTDVTELRRTQEELLSSEERFRLAFEEALTGMALIDIADRPGHFLRVNRALTTFLGRGSEQLLDTTLFEVAHAEDVTGLHLALSDLVTERSSGHQGEQRFAHSSGATRWAVMSISTVRGHAGYAHYALVALEDITARKNAENQLAYRALHDELTGLPNRALLLDHLRAALARARRTDTQVSALFIDLDDFKSVNDSFGHEAGDEFLVKVANRIMHSIREVDIAARIGGDEFVVVCENLTDSGEATTVAQRIQSALGIGINIADRQVSAPASIGIALGNAQSTAESVLREADEAMYVAKRRGGRRWHPADGVTQAPAHDVLTLEGDLREAIRLGQLCLYYQPTFDLRTNRIIGAEALLRWRHPTRGLLLPQTLIEVAERRNLIEPIGDWVLTVACTQAADWMQRLGENAPVVAINVSSQQLGDGLSRQVLRLLAQHHLPAEKLCLEITESQFINVGSSAVADLRALSAAGIEIAVDDFGTGFSGFDYLRRLPVHTIKIDRSYIKGLGRDRTDSAIVASVITLALNLGLTTIAEGIESDDQYHALKGLGCATGQGWLWQPALPPEQLESLIRAEGRENG